MLSLIERFSQYLADYWPDLLESLVVVAFVGLFILSIVMAFITAGST